MNFMTVEYSPEEQEYITFLKSGGREYENPLQRDTKIFTSRSKGRDRVRRSPETIVLFDRGDGTYLSLPPKGDVKNGLDDFAANKYPEDTRLAGEDPVERLQKDLSKLIEEKLQ